ncbi:hypothetical protein ANN_03109 [Periplaneta americana]|uniref:Uncharacterized protein n=1 Tax=Periplaneta americana TaxID=6978 RepID=A0ABQ8U1Z0_PERAM|nr:hypothetical protein ANN_03109 [Periplaneta americana]
MINCFQLSASTLLRVMTIYTEKPLVLYGFRNYSSKTKFFQTDQERKRTMHIGFSLESTNDYGLHHNSAAFLYIFCHSYYYSMMYRIVSNMKKGKELSIELKLTIISLALRGYSLRKIGNIVKNLTQQQRIRRYLVGPFDEYYGSMDIAEESQEKGHMDMYLRNGVKNRYITSKMSRFGSRYNTEDWSYRLCFAFNPLQHSGCSEEPQFSFFLYSYSTDVPP